MDDVSHVRPALWRGKRPLYAAKIGTHGSTLILVKRARRFQIGQRIQFAELSDVSGMAVGMAPRWRHGIIWKIEQEWLFVNLH